MLASVAAAHAQTAVTTGAPSPVPTQAYDVPQVDRLFGNWGGVQIGLQQRGINVQLDAVSEFAGNVSGGTKKGATFANQVGVQTDVNWERLAGILGLSTHVIIVQRSGSSDSALFGDNLLPVQEVYGSGGDVGLHLVSAYAQETLLRGKFDVAAGRMNVENDFASSPLYCNFMNNGLCGDPKALPGGDIGHSAYPDAVWAGRIQLRPLPALYIRTGVYDVNQGLYSDTGFRTGFKFDESRSSGVYVPVELGWESSLGADKLPGHYKLGFGYDSSGGYKDFGNALAAAAVPGFAATTRTSNTQTWVLVDQVLLRTGPGASQGLVALAGFIHNDPNNSAYAEQYIAGAVLRGFWKARPQDAVGLLFLHDTISGRLGGVQGVEQALALAYSNKSTGIQTSESLVEANYDVQVVKGVNVTPDFQFVIHPNAERAIRDAAVFGFKAHLEF